MNHEQPIIPEQSPPEPPEQPAGRPEEHEAAASLRPHIWVASLADYNNGVQHGSWIDAGRDEEQLQADIDTMLAASPWTAQTGEPAEAWAVHDTDGFGLLHIDEHESLRWISLVGKGIAEHGLAFAVWADVMEEEAELADFDKAYLGHYDDLHSYLEQLINDLGYDRIISEAIPAPIRPYVKIDITATAEDLLKGGDLHAIPAAGGGVWIFHG